MVGQLTPNDSQDPGGPRSKIGLAVLFLQFRPSGVSAYPMRQTSVALTPEYHVRRIPFSGTSIRHPMNCSSQLPGSPGRRTGSGNFVQVTPSAEIARPKGAGRL